MERERLAAKQVPHASGSKGASTSKNGASKDVKRMSDVELLMPNSGSPSDNTRSKRPLIDEEVLIFDVKRRQAQDNQAHFLSQAQRSLMVQNLALSIYVNNHPFRMVDCPHLKASYAVANVQLPGRDVSNMLLIVGHPHHPLHLFYTGDWWSDVG
jgi:hypothetical protein